MENFSRKTSFVGRIAALVVASFALTAPLPAAPPAPSWDVRNIEGREYLAVDSIRQFYQFTDQSRAGKSLVLEKKVKDKKTGKLVTVLVMKLSVGGNECLMNNVKFIFSNDIVTLNDKVFISRLDFEKLIDPVLRPNFIKNAGNFKTVILDPGHGGKDPGATNAIGTEAKYNIKVATLVKQKLEAKGYKVVMTRETDIYQSLQDRVNIANEVTEESVYVSIHFNSGGSSARGVETFTLSPPGVSHYGRDFRTDDNQQRAGNEHDSANIALATAIHGSVLKHLAQYTLDRGIKRARFSVLSGVRHPAILLEGGFMTNPYESKLIDNAKFQNTIADAISAAIDKYRTAMNPAKTVPN